MSVDDIQPHGRKFEILRMKIIENKPIYRCEHCGKLSLSQSGMQRHETACRKNPANWAACGGCAHLDVTYKWYDDKEVPCSFYCKLKNKRMYHSKVLRFANAERRNDIISGCDMVMPSVKDGCPDFSMTMP